MLNSVEIILVRLVEGEAGEVRWWFQLRTGMTLFP